MEEEEVKRLSILAVKRQLEQMTVDDLLRLKETCERAVSHPVKKQAGFCIEDLLQEAFTRMIEGRRVWKRRDGLTFTNFCIGVVKSIASHEVERRAEGPIADVTLEIEALDEGARVDETLMVKETLEEIFSLFQGDDGALFYLRGRAEGLTFRQITDNFSLSKSQLEAARKRVMRKLRSRYHKENRYDC